MFVRAHAQVQARAAAQPWTVPAWGSQVDTPDEQVWLLRVVFIRALFAFRPLIVADCLLAILTPRAQFFAQYQSDITYFAGEPCYLCDGVYFGGGFGSSSGSNGADADSPAAFAPTPPLVR